MADMLSTGSLWTDPLCCSKCPHLESSKVDAVLGRSVDHSMKFGTLLMHFVLMKLLFKNLWKFVSPTQIRTDHRVSLSLGMRVFSLLYHLVNKVRYP